MKRDDSGDDSAYTFHILALNREARSKARGAASQKVSAGKAVKAERAAGDSNSGMSWLADIASMNAASSAPAGHSR
jgi:hypothetical protein